MLVTRIIVLVFPAGACRRYIYVEEPLLLYVLCVVFNSVAEAMALPWVQ